jgi:adenosine deaminase
MNQINRYFENIRHQEASLKSFFEQMPKGADLHHHALGAIWAEDVLELAAEMGLWVDLKTGQLHQIPAKAWYKASEILRNEALYNQLIDQWSVRNFGAGAQAAPQHFFDIFPKLEPVFVEQEAYWLKKIAQQAAKENISYIETLIEVPAERNRVSNWALEYEDWPESPTEIDFEAFYDYMKQKGIGSVLARIIENVTAWQKELETLEEAAKIGFQLYAIRTFSALEVFAQLIASFKAAANSDLIVGVNLVAPEHHPTSLKDYCLHMQFVAWLKKRFPEVNVALHAGELTKKLVAEEHLQFHIDLAVHQAKALRIGHGVDLMEELQNKEILESMKAEGVALEVLLDSNDFILNVSPKQHPFMTYWKAGVPLILATDDPALLRINLADQFVVAAKAFPLLEYNDFKQLAFNSIDYSFLNSKEILVLKNKLNAAFNQFEEGILTQKH